MKTEDIPYDYVLLRTSNARKQSIACVAMPQYRRGTSDLTGISLYILD